MSSRFALCVLSLAVGWSLLLAPCQAGPEPPVRLKKKESPKTPLPLPQRERSARDAPPEKTKGSPASQEALDAAAILARLSKNMGESEKRLAEKDFRDATREIQSDIIKDLDMLIEQAKRAQHSQQSQRTISPSQDQLQQARRMVGSPRVPQSREPQPAPQQGRQPPSKARGDGPGNMADLYKDIWGHLPEALRQEMDHYSREQFMAKYSELLKQYYATVAEKGHRKENR